jgi:hypothetical protein
MGFMRPEAAKHIEEHEFGPSADGAEEHTNQSSGTGYIYVTQKEAVTCLQRL